MKKTLFRLLIFSLFIFPLAIEITNGFPPPQSSAANPKTNRTIKNYTFKNIHETELSKEWDEDEATESRTGDQITASLWGGVLNTIYNILFGRCPEGEFVVGLEDTGEIICEKAGCPELNETTYDPICGADNMTYPNECYAINAGADYREDLSGNGIGTTPSPCKEVCNDGRDNDNDGFVDCLDKIGIDSDCINNSACLDQGNEKETNCSNGADDDGDGNVDCADTDCINDLACTGSGPGGISNDCGIVEHNGLTYETIRIDNIDNLCWLSKNLGAEQIAESISDSLSFGDLYQWGRGTDGHEKKNSETTPVPNEYMPPGHTKFITGVMDPNSSHWTYHEPSTDIAWYVNPCPTGWRIPARDEFDRLLTTEAISNIQEAYDSPLKFPNTPYRNGYDGTYYNNDSGNDLGISSGTFNNSRYWTSDPVIYDDEHRTYKYYANYVEFSSNQAFTNTGTFSAYPYHGYSLRCVKDPLKSCSDGKMNDKETGKDCGGPDCPACEECQTANKCNNNTNCIGHPSCCSNSIKDGDEINIDCGGSCSACITCPETIQSRDGLTTYNIITAEDNNCWLATDLGTTKAGTAGDLFQWGRYSDGHEKRTSSNSSYATNKDQPSNGSFITQLYATNNYDWRKGHNDNLWQGGVNAINNPCPEGAYIPTSAEWKDWATKAGVTSYNYRTRASKSLLKLPFTGWRKYSTGAIEFADSHIDYWTSSINLSERSIAFIIGAHSAEYLDYKRASGFAVRCKLDPSYTATCTDEIQNQGEEGIDCGGPCTDQKCPSCKSPAPTSRAYENTPTKPDTDWQDADSDAPCYFTCQGGYKFDSDANTCKLAMTLSPSGSVDFEVDGSKIDRRIYKDDPNSLWTWGNIKLFTITNNGAPIKESLCIDKTKADRLKTTDFFGIHNNQCSVELGTGKSCTFQISSKYNQNESTTKELEFGDCSNYSTPLLHATLKGTAYNFTGECNEGTKQCSGTTIQVCNSDGNWENQENCPKGCIDGTCRTCANNETRCIDGKKEICNYKGQWSKSNIDCSACKYNGDQQCDGSAQQVCKNNVWINNIEQYGINGYYCTEEAPNCITKKKDDFVNVTSCTCKVGSQKCDGTYTIVECTANGWDKYITRPDDTVCIDDRGDTQDKRDEYSFPLKADYDPKFVCYHGEEGEDGNVQIGDKKCSGSNSSGMKTCQANGSWNNALCPASEYCVVDDEGVTKCQCGYEDPWTSLNHKCVSPTLLNECVNNIWIKEKECDTSCKNNFNDGQTIWYGGRCNECTPGQEDCKVDKYGYDIIRKCNTNGFWEWEEGALRCGVFGKKCIEVTDTEAKCEECAKDGYRKCKEDNSEMIQSCSNYLWKDELSCIEDYECINDFENHNAYCLPK